MPEVVYSSAEIMAAIESLRGMLTVVQQAQGVQSQTLQTLSQQEISMAKKLSEFATEFQTRFDALTADVAAGKTVSESAITLLNGIAAQNAAFKAQIQELIDAAGTDEDRAKLQAIADGMDAQNAAMDAQRQALADAITANTPSTPSNPA